MLKSQLIRNGIQKGFEAGNSKIADKIFTATPSRRRWPCCQRSGSTDCPLDLMNAISPAIASVKLRTALKAEPDDKLVEHNCSTCEFNFGNVCAGHGVRTDNSQDTFGMSMQEADKMFPVGCDDYGISFEAFIEQEKLSVR